MDTLWPWLALAGMGVVHGAHPANGWMWVTLRTTPRRSLARCWLALWPVAIGHAVAIAVTVYALSRGVPVSGPWAQRIAGLVLLVLACVHFGRGSERIARSSMPTLLASSTAVTSALMATAHGAGLMLVPALLPLCMSSLPARAITGSGSLLLGLAAVIVHLGAMLLTAGGIAGLLHAGAHRLPHLDHAVLASACSVALALLGIHLALTA